MFWDKEQLQFAKAYYSVHGECDHPWYDMSYQDWNGDVAYFKCRICQHVKAIINLCQCKPWFYLDAPKLNIQGRCTECYLYRSEEYIT